ncbi:MAG: PAS domain S-box protein [Dissulfurispiraceae bacterium]
MSIKKQKTLPLAKQRNIEKELKNSESISRAIIDTLSAHIALLDRNGTIQRVNKAWREFVTNKGSLAEEIREGVNYLEVYDKVSPCCDSETCANTAKEIAANIRAILSGESQEFTLEYECSSPEVVRFFKTRVAKFMIGNQPNVIVIHEDISDLKKVKETLQESEARYRMLVETTNEGVWFLDANHVTTFVNPAMAHMLGYTIEDMLGSPIKDFISAEDMEHHARQMNARQMGMDESYERRFKRKDGSVLWALVSAKAIKDANGYFSGSFGVITNISERKLKEQILEDREGRISAIMNTTVDAIITINEDALVESFNKAAEHIFGYEALEVIGRNINMLMPEPYHSNHDGYLREYFTTGIKRVIDCESELVGKRKDGSVFPIELAVSEVLLTDRRIFTGSVRDITGRKLSEDALLKSEARYRRITEGLTDYQYTVRIENGRAVETKHSPACVAITGYTAEEFVSDPYLWINMVAPEDRELIRRRVEQILEGNDILPIEHRIIRKDGILRWVSDNIILYRDISGTLLSYDGVVKDITEHKQSEETLRKTHQALEKAYTDLKAAQSQMLQQEKMASIGQLSAGVAHEIKNPLAIIVQGVDSLQGPHSDSLRADVSEMIKKAAIRAAKIVNDLLSFARQSPLSLEKMDIVSIIDETLSLVEHQLNLKNIGIIRQFEEGNLIALVDSDQIKQVFINVLLNAADAMRQGGAIEIDAGMTVMPTTGKPAVRISFSDNGCGIEPENIEKIFDPFFTTKRDSGGTGLGLAVSHRIIENHGGTITIESRVGEGTRVVVTLPAPEQ